MKTVGVIGIKGKYGQFLERLFIDFGCRVIGSDIKDGLGINSRNIEIINKSDVVIFSVPSRNVCKIINDLVPYSRANQLWMDVTSVKVAPIQVMLKSEAEVVGLHPMCAPTLESLRGQTIVACPMNLNDWGSWVGQFLVWTGARVKVCTPAKHDRMMAIVQGLVHAMQLTMAATIRSLDEDIRESLEFTSPVYKIAISLIGRILKQNPSLYADIQMLNPHIPEVLNQAAKELKNLNEIVVEQKQEKFAEQFILNREHFGRNELDDAYALFEELSQLLADRSSEHQITLEIEDNRSGLLAAITGIFAGNGVNLSHIHSFNTSKGIRFLIGLDRTKDSPMVKNSIEQMAERGLIKIEGK